MINAARGAVTTENDAGAVSRDTRLMLGEMLRLNGIGPEDAVSVLFSCTRDITAAYPAVTAREMGMTRAAIMCLQEMRVEGSLEKCIRAEIIFESEKSQAEVKHAYLKGAAGLRPDLAGKGE